MAMIGPYVGVKAYTSWGRKTYWIPARRSDCDLAKRRKDGNMGKESHLSSTVEFDLGRLGQGNGCGCR